MNELFEEEVIRKKEGEEEDGGRRGEKKTSRVLARDLGLLRLCYEQGFLTRRQVKKWLEFGSGLKTKETAKTVSIRALNRLREERLIEFFQINQVTDREAFRVTARGMALLLDTGIFQKRDLVSSPDPEQIRHDIVATDIRLTWAQILPQYIWRSDRLLRGEKSDNFPDAKLTFLGGKSLGETRAAIEVELTQKGRARYEKKFHEYENDEGEYDIVFYFTKNQQITNVIHEVSRGVTDLIFVCQVDDFLKNKAATRMASNNDHFHVHERILCA